MSYLFFTIPRHRCISCCLLESHFADVQNNASICIIGASLSKPHTSKKDVCDRPSMEIYNQMQKIANSRSNTKQTNVESVTQKLDNIQESHSTLEIKFVWSTITRRIIGVIC